MCIYIYIYRERERETERDRLGWLNLSHAGIWRRDHHVISECVRLGIPCVTVIGGGQGFQGYGFHLSTTHFGIL